MYFVRGVKNKKPWVKWEVMPKHPEEGRTGINYPTNTLDAAKINMLKKLITSAIQPWMGWIERKLIRAVNGWDVEK